MTTLPASSKNKSCSIRPPMKVLFKKTLNPLFRAINSLPSCRQHFAKGLFSLRALMPPSRPALRSLFIRLRGQKPEKPPSCTAHHTDWKTDACDTNSDKEPHGFRMHAFSDNCWPGGSGQACRTLFIRLRGLLARGWL